MGQEKFRRPLLYTGRNMDRGFMDYNDTSTTAGVALAADTWTAIPNNGLGSFTNKTYRPRDISMEGRLFEILDTTTGKIDPTHLSLGDTILVRNDIRITPNINGSFLQFRYTLGTGGGAYTLTQNLGTLSNGALIEYPIQFLDFIYLGDSNTRDNPIGLEINCSEAATYVNLGCVIQVNRA